MYGMSLLFCFVVCFVSAVLFLYWYIRLRIRKGEEICAAGQERGITGKDALLTRESNRRRVAEEQPMTMKEYIDNTSGHHKIAALKRARETKDEKE